MASPEQTPGSDPVETFRAMREYVSAYPSLADACADERRLLGEFEADPWTCPPIVRAELARRAADTTTTHAAGLRAVVVPQTAEYWRVMLARARGRQSTAGNM